MHQNPFRQPNPVEPKYGHGKKTTICGAPQCRCTPLLLAMCIALAGLVLVGVGSCICGFMGNDATPKTLGFGLIGIGILMMIAGAACFVYDNYIRAQFPIGQTVGYAYQPQESTQFDQPSTSYGAAGPYDAAGPSTSDDHKGAKGSENVAPPAYDTVLQLKSDPPRSSSGHGSRGSKGHLVV